MEVINTTANGTVLDNSTFYEDMPPSAPAMKHTAYISCVLLTMICICGLIGNLMSMIVFSRNSSMKTASMVYIFNLALADFLFLLTVPMTITNIILRRWVFGEIMCKAFYGMYGINVFGSVYTLVLMSVDRFIAICCMKMKDVRTTTNSVISCVCIWILSVLLSLPLLMYASCNGTEHCSIWWPSKHGTEVVEVYTYYTMSAGFIFPLAVIMILYTAIVVKINTQKTELSGINQKHKRERNQRVTGLVLVIIMAFVICWLPHWIIQVYIIVRKEHSLAIMIGAMVASCFYTFNSALNPFLYGFMSANFRKAVSKSCSCQPAVRLGDGSQSRGLLLSLGGRRKAENNDVTTELPSRSPKTSIRTVSTLREQVMLLESKDIKCNNNLLTVT